MKKIIGIILTFILVCFTIPIIFVQKSKQTSTEIRISEEQGIEEAKSNEQNNVINVKLLHTATGEIEELDMNVYLYGVVSAEMPADFAEEALKAQSVVARTYTIYRVSNEKKHENADMCDSINCCQAWISKADRLEKWEETSREQNWSKIVNAVESTQNEIITYSGEAINALFHANSGGITEIASNVWGGQDYPYLQSVATSGESNYKQYSSEIIITKQELLDKLKSVYIECEMDFANEEIIKILEYTEAGRVKTVKFGNINIAGAEVRNIIGLKSTNFIIEVLENDVKFTVFGYGHGVGMSQTGANSLANSGKTYQEIIYHYYKDVEIENLS